MGLAGRQSGACRCALHDRWIGWIRNLRLDRLHLIRDNTRFLIPGAPGVFPDLASHALAAMTRRLSDDRRDAHGHGLPVAETFVDPSRFSGGMSRAAGWTPVGRTKGYARSNGRHTEIDAVPKELHVPDLRRDSRRRQAHPWREPQRGRGRHKTVTLVARDTGLPVAGLDFNDEGGERAAVQALPEWFPSRDGLSPSTRCTQPGTPPAASSGSTGPTGS